MVRSDPVDTFTLTSVLHRGDLPDGARFEPPIRNTGPMSVPASISRGARTRIPLTPEGYKEFVERRVIRDRLAELTGRLAELEVQLKVPPQLPNSFKYGKKPKPPAAGAESGEIEMIRGAWVAKFDPARGQRDPDVGESDPFLGYPWEDPEQASMESWLHRGLMRGLASKSEDVQPGDLVFVLRTRPLPTDPSWLRRRALIGVWIVDHLYAPGRGVDEIVTLPLRRFDFPVPLREASQMDAALDAVSTFHDRSRSAFGALSADEALCVAAACGLPASVFTEPDVAVLMHTLAGMHLGPSTEVARRILQGAKAADHVRRVESAARNLIVGELRAQNLSVVSTENLHGVGSDLWCNSQREGGPGDEFRVEVKGLSGNDPYNARLTRNERSNRNKLGPVDLLAVGRPDTWHLAVVTRALQQSPVDTWFSAQDVVTIWTKSVSGGAVFTAVRGSRGAPPGGCLSGGPP